MQPLIQHTACVLVLYRGYVICDIIHTTLYDHWLLLPHVAVPPIRVGVGRPEDRARGPHYPDLCHDWLGSAHSTCCEGSNIIGHCVYIQRRLVSFVLVPVLFGCQLRLCFIRLYSWEVTITFFPVCARRFSSRLPPHLPLATIPCPPRTTHRPPSLCGPNRWLSYDKHIHMFVRSIQCSDSMHMSSMLCSVYWAHRFSGTVRLLWSGMFPGPPLQIR